jgi:TonB family protein
MADTKTLFNQRFEAARTAFTKGDEPAAAESLHSAIVVARSDPALRRELASALFHLGKLSRKFGRAGEAEAESLLTEALAISEELFGRENAAVAPLLNELGRLHIHRSQFARAAEVLERLLAIARAKGEENADVATVLAGLAVVKRKLGDDASAETLYRDALRIREKVLEPHNMVTVVTLEHLSETCAARGNFDEALSLLRRGLAAREVALGPGHATVQAGKSRLAELELQAAVAADTAAAAAAKAARGAIATPVWLKRVPDLPINTPSTTLPSPINSKKLEFLPEPEPRVLRPAAPSREFAKTPRVTAAVAAASLMASSIQMPPASQIVVSPPPPESARPSESLAGLASGVMYRDAIVPDVARSDVASDHGALGESQSSVAAVEDDSVQQARKQRTALYAAVGAAAVVTAIAGLLMVHPHSAASSPGSAKTSGAQRTTVARTPVATPPAPTTGTVAAGAAAVVGAARADSLRLASAASAPAAPVSQSETRAGESAPPELHLPRVNVQVRPINIPSVVVPSMSAAPNGDSSAPRPADTGRTGTAQRLSLPTSLDIGTAVTPARIIGRAPEPGFPEELLRSGRRDGQVVVRFIVNEFGRVDVPTMIVERSDDELFTAAVREILPDFRFQPARTRAPESKPVGSWVSVPFRFTTKKK